MKISGEVGHETSFLRPMPCAEHRGRLQHGMTKGGLLQFF